MCCSDCTREESGLSKSVKSVIILESARDFAGGSTGSLFKKTLSWFLRRPGNNLWSIILSDDGDD